jgi:hypothetical protein
MNRRSPIGDGRWRRPWLEPAEHDPDEVASEERWARWNAACGLFALATAVYFLVRCVL